jgi:hypothetical protein
MAGMRLHTVAMLLAAACAGASAQEGDLSGVTMRVVDDLSGIDAVVIVLEPIAGARPAPPEGGIDGAGAPQR